MNKLSLKTGRVDQKKNTRAKILQAAQTLMKKSRSISLEDVASKAKVSRATIYRYFPNVELLYTEASLDIHHASPEELYEKVKKMPLEKRLLHIQKVYNSLAQEHELVFRRYLSTILLDSVTTKKKLRGSRRTMTMDLALEDHHKELSKKDLNNLRNISSVLMGIDALLVCKDVCHMNDRETDDLLRWALKTIMKGMDIRS